MLSNVFSSVLYEFEVLEMSFGDRSFVPFWGWIELHCDDLNAVPSCSTGCEEEAVEEDDRPLTEAQEHEERAASGA